MERRRINYPVSGFSTNAVDDMFSLQKMLVERFMDIEGLPRYPLNLNEKPAQKLMKDFIRRGIEELSEAHSVYQLVCTTVEKGYLDSSETLVVKDNILDINEELSDALHFFIEAMLYANIYSFDILDYYEKLARKLGIQPTPGNTLQTIIEVSRTMLSLEMYDPYQGFKTINPANEEIFYHKCAGRNVNRGLLYQQAQLMWEVTHNFSKAMNLLKNNPWKQTTVETNIPLFHEQMMMGWISLMNLMVFCGYDAEGLFLSYCHKNAINHERINSKR